VLALSLTYAPGVVARNLAARRPQEL